MRNNRLTYRIEGMRFLVILVLLVIILAGCKAQEEEKTYGGPDTGPAYGDLFIDASIGDATPFTSPGRGRRLRHHQLPDLQRSGEYAGGLNLVGDLARKLGRLLRTGSPLPFHLRKGVKWQDGAPFTAQDVLFTYQVMVDPKTPRPIPGIISR